MDDGRGIPDQETPQHDLAGRKLGEDNARRARVLLHDGRGHRLGGLADGLEQLLAYLPRRRRTCPSIFRRGEWTTRTFTGLPPKVPANSETSGKTSD